MNYLKIILPVLVITHTVLPAQALSITRNDKATLTKLGIATIGLFIIAKQLVSIHETRDKATHGLIQTPHDHVQQQPIAHHKEKSLFAQYPLSNRKLRMQQVRSLYQFHMGTSYSDLQKIESKELDPYLKGKGTDWRTLSSSSSITNEDYPLLEHCYTTLLNLYVTNVKQFPKILESLQEEDSKYGLILHPEVYAE